MSARPAVARIGAVVLKEWLELRGNKVLVSTFVILPLVLTSMTLGQLALASTSPNTPISAVELAKLPAGIAAVATTQREALSLIMVHLAPALFVLVQTLLPAIVATHSIVGEKQARSLEPLLATPIRTWELLVAKVAASVCPGVLFALLGATLYVAVASRLAAPLAWALVCSPEWLLSVGLLGPLAAVLAVAFAVLVSSRSAEIQTAQSMVGLVALPVLGLGIAQMFEASLLSVPNVLAAAAVLTTADVLALALAASVFERETILSRWR